MLTVSDIKQYVYCPRIVFYRHVLPLPCVTTPKMTVGREAHFEMRKLERRRTLRRYRLQDGNRVFNHEFVSEHLGLTGKVDMLIEGNRAYFPVEFKYSYGEPGLHHRYQLIAYSLLVEEAMQSVVRGGYIYMLASDEVFWIDIPETKKIFLKKLITRIKRVISGEELPAPTPHRGRCTNCEYRLYCGDV